MLKPCTILAVGLAAFAAAHAPALALPDAAIARIGIPAESLRDGDQVPISVELANRGDSPLPPAPVVLTIDGEPYAEWKPPAQLPPGDSAVWSSVWIARRGSHLIAATADPLADVAEADETNNSGSVTVAVESAPLPSPWPAVFAGGAGLLVGLAAAALARRLRPSSPPAGAP
jgi:subtilase family serine protease